MKIISEAHKETRNDYGMCYDNLNGGGGYMFECDEKGVIDTAKFNPAALTNYNKCISGEVKTSRPPYIQKYSHEYMVWAVGKCDECGNEVELVPEQGDGIGCVCGSLYNQLGNRLRPRLEWEEK